MTDPNLDLNAALGRYQQEVVRWNKQINLVSRQGTLGRVAGLITQCRGAWQKLVSEDLKHWGADSPVGYFDLGSGGGVPGYVWHQLLGLRYTNVKTWLVEPREKRAWFLERLNTITPRHPLVVWRGRWGETPTAEAPAGLANILISLKALHLPDPVVLAGLSGALAGVDCRTGGRVVIARFYPPDQKWSSSLAGELAFASEVTKVGDRSYVPVGHHVLRPRPFDPKAAALVVCTYEISE